MIVFDDAFLATLPEDRIKAAYQMCERFQAAEAALGAAGADVAQYASFLEALGAFQAFCEAFGISCSIPTLGADKQANINAIRGFFAAVQRELDSQVTNVALQAARDRYREKFKIAFAYEISEGDLHQIHARMNELRGMIMNSLPLEAVYKQRLLNRVNSLQMELHKQMTSLDKCWGLIGDACVVQSKGGPEGRAFANHVMEIARLIWFTQARSERLPSGLSFPLTLSELPASPQG